MSASDNMERVLRSLHVLLSQSDPVQGKPGTVAVDKQKVLDLLAELNKSVYQIMDDYEVTKQSRDKAERESRKQGEDIVREASRTAEDIYAAAVMYTDGALSEVYALMEKNQAQIALLYDEMEKKLKEQEAKVKRNQSDLKGQLQDLVDTEKYLKLIEEYNKEREKERAKKDGIDVSEAGRPSIYANRQTEVRVNTAVLEQLGMAPEVEEEAAPAMTEEEQKAAEAEIRVDLDADYFAWREEEEAKAAGHQTEDKSGKSDSKKSEGRRTIRLFSALSGVTNKDEEQTDEGDTDNDDSGM